MDDFDSELRIDIRDRVRDHGRRRLAIARLSAPADWEGALRHAIRQHRQPVTIFSGSDLKLFVQSFLVCFTATMVFLM